MSLKIRLSRGGSKGDAHYRIVVMESTKSRDGQAIDTVGHYHPNFHDEEKRIVMDTEKVNKWVSVGAKPTEVVVRLCLKKGLSNFEKFVVKHPQTKNFKKTKKEIKVENSAN